MILEHGNRQQMSGQKMISLQVFEIGLGRQAKEGMKCVAINIEGCYTSRCSDTELILQEYPEAVNEI